MKIQLDAAQQEKVAVELQIHATMVEMKQDKFTTMAIGEEGDFATTLAIGEEC